MIGLLMNYPLLQCQLARVTLFQCPKDVTVTDYVMRDTKLATLTDLDPGASVPHEVRPHRRLELVLCAHLPRVGLDETRVHALRKENRCMSSVYTGNRL